MIYDIYACLGSAERVDYMWPEVAGVFTFNRDGGFRYIGVSRRGKRSRHQREFSRKTVLEKRLRKHREKS